MKSAASYMGKHLLIERAFKVDQNTWPFKKSMAPCLTGLTITDFKRNEVVAVPVMPVGIVSWQCSCF